ncbi:MAG: polymer-forming cytoskeletal protein [Oscillospiraceae bacterium]|jgi:cytoskeletal protein CcmA (bactofilin family)|nr:polymer-forming cytoskeletal protein [Oscillospiraceae bacterium]
MALKRERYDSFPAVEPPPDTTPSFIQSATVIGQGIKLELAKLSGSETVIINGTCLGDIDLNGSLVVGETGSIIGNIRARGIEIAGKVKGGLLCDGTIYLAATAYVEGAIATNALKTEEGARINGQCRMSDEKSERMSLELYEKEGKLEFDFAELADAVIPDTGLPAVPA